MKFIDQMGNLIVLDKTPKRIVSLVPSQTELLYYLRVPPIAQTIFCIHPDQDYKKANKIGGTKKLNIQKIIDLKPDLIIGNKEENDEHQILELQKLFPVWMSDIYSLKDAYEMIVSLGRILDEDEAAINLKLQIERSFSRLITPNFNKTVLYLIWNNPYFGVAKNTFVDDLISTLGFTNVLKEEDRYPELSDKKIQELNPDLVFLSSEPFPFKKEHQKKLETLLPSSSVLFVDGESFSWYGNRLLDTPFYFENLISDIRTHESES